MWWQEAAALNDIMRHFMHKVCRHEVRRRAIPVFLAAQRPVKIVQLLCLTVTDDDPAWGSGMPHEQARLSQLSPKCPGWQNQARWARLGARWGRMPFGGAGDLPDITSTRKETHSETHCWLCWLARKHICIRCSESLDQNFSKGTLTARGQIKSSSSILSL